MARADAGAERRHLAWWPVWAIVAVMLAALPAGASAQAIGPLDCSGNTIYQIQRASSGSTTGRLNTLDVAPMVPNYTGPVTATQTTPSLIPATSPGANALGITEGGRGAWGLAPQSPSVSGSTLTFTLRQFNTATGAWTSHTAAINTANRLPSGVTASGIASQGIVAGAIDPRNNNYYWAYLANAPTNRMVIFGWDTARNEPLGVVAYSTLPQTTPASGSSNGDIAFDGAGNLYVVSNTGTHAAVGVIAGSELPTQEQATTHFVQNERLTSFDNPNSNSYNGIAFNSLGELFIQWSTGDTTTTVRKISPQPPGASIAGPSTVTFSPTGGGIGVDLAGCAVPPSLQLRKYVSSRRAPSDQFHLSITGGGFTAGGDANTATTTGTSTGVQDESAGPLVARAGTTYTFTETGAGSTNLSHYTIEWHCVDQAAGNADVADGTGPTFPITPSPGQAILCTFRNIYPALPDIHVVKTGVLDAGPDGVAGAGDTIHYTIRVRNTGNVTLTNVRVTDSLLSPVACPPAGTDVIASLEPGELEDCTATHVLTQADVDTGYVPNFATAIGTPPQGNDVEDGDDEEVPVEAVPRIHVEKSGTLDKGANHVTNPGDTIHYAITVTNTGNVTLTNVRVTDSLLSPVVCPPAGTSVIPALAVGQSETCTATHRVTQHDIDVGYVPNFATATGTPPHGGDVEDGDSETVRIKRRPAIAVVKTGKLDTGADSAAGVGDVIRYTIRVRNTGNVTLRNVRVVEQSLAGLSAIDCGGGTHVIATLRVRHSVTCTATYTVTQADAEVGFVPNFATATGTPPHGPDVEDGDDEEVPVAAVPELNVSKTGRLASGAAGARAGDTIHYTITVRNVGNVTLTNVTVTEPLLSGVSAIDCGGGTNVIATLGVGRSATCTATYVVTQADVDAGFVPNFAIATGTPPRGPDVTDGDNHVLGAVASRAVLALRKTASPATVTRGATVRFRLRVANTSGVTARGVRVCDTRPRGLTVVSAPGFTVRGRTLCRRVGTLSPGRSRTLVLTARVGAGAPSRVTNTAVATAGNAGSVRAAARVSIRGRPVVTG